MVSTVSSLGVITDVPPHTALTVLNPIDVDAVGLVLTTGILDLWPIFRGKDPTRAPGSSTRPLIAGKIEGPPTCRLRSVAESSGRKLRQLKNITVERWHVVESDYS